MILSSNTFINRLKIKIDNIFIKNGLNFHLYTNFFLSGLKVNQYLNSMFVLWSKFFP